MSWQSFFMFITILLVMVQSCMTKWSHYSALGLAPGATSEQIKKRYRRLAMKYHPDKNLDNKTKSEEIFKKINAAYEVLGDTEKRKRYDEVGDEPPQVFDSTRTSRGRSFPHNVFSQSHFSTSTFDKNLGTDADDIISEFMRVFEVGRMRTHSQAGSSNFKFSSFSNRQTGTPQKFPPIQLDIRCGLEELYSGCVKHMRVRSHISDGFRLVPIEKVYRSIRIPAGTTEGFKLSYPATAAFPRDVIFIVLEQPHKIFRRVGLDLHWTCTLPKRKLIKGALINLTLLDGERLQIDTRNFAINNGSVIEFEHKGFCNGADRGKLIIRFVVT